VSSQGLRGRVGAVGGRRDYEPIGAQNRQRGKRKEEMEGEATIK